MLPTLLMFVVLNPIFGITKAAHTPVGVSFQIVEYHSHKAYTIEMLNKEYQAQQFIARSA